MRNTFPAFLAFVLDLYVGVVHAQDINLKYLAETVPNVAIVTIDGQKITVREVVYSDANKGFPTLRLPQSHNFKGDYLIFIPAGADINLNNVGAMRIRDGVVTLYGGGNPPTGRRIPQKPYPATEKRKIPVAELVKQLKQLHHKRPRSKN